jgi:hypothetical protein
MEIKDNTFARQFENQQKGYFQLNTLFKKKNISDKINIPDQFDNEEFVFSY